MVAAWTGLQGQATERGCCVQVGKGAWVGAGVTLDSWDGVKGDLGLGPGQLLASSARMLREAGEAEASEVPEDTDLLLWV